MRSATAMDDLAALGSLMSLSAPDPPGDYSSRRGSVAGSGSGNNDGGSKRKKGRGGTTWEDDDDCDDGDGPTSKLARSGAGDRVQVGVMVTGRDAPSNDRRPDPDGARGDDSGTTIAHANETC